MISTKKTNEAINYLSHIGDLLSQKDRQVEFWRSVSRERMKKNQKLHERNQKLHEALSWAKNDWTGNEPSESVMHRYFDELGID